VVSARCDLMDRCISWYNRIGATVCIRAENSKGMLIDRDWICGHFVIAFSTSINLTPSNLILIRWLLRMKSMPRVELSRLRSVRDRMFGVREKNSRFFAGGICDDMCR
jgi:hypothetical protein